MNPVGVVWVRDCCCEPSWGGLGTRLLSPVLFFLGGGGGGGGGSWICTCVPLMGTVLESCETYEFSCHFIHQKCLLCLRGVLETLVQRHFPTPSSGINWNLFDSDPTLPGSCRRSRKRGEEQ